jgi:hypothetical protein
MSNEQRSNKGGGAILRPMWRSNERWAAILPVGREPGLIAYE